MKKRNPWSDSESDMSSDENNFDVPPRETEPRRAATKTKFTVDLDSDEDFSDSDEKTQDDDFVPSDASPPKTKPSPKHTNKDPKPQKSATSGHAPAAAIRTQKRAAPKKTTKKDPGLNSDVSQKPEAPKTKVPRRRKLSASDDSDSSFEKGISRAVTSKKPKAESDDFHLELDATVAPRAKSGRAKKPIKYLEESDEDDLF